MTTHTTLHAMTRLVADLAQDLPEGERLRRLLAALRAVLPADAAVLLRLESQWLRPMAIDGLVPDALGRRFRIDEHPRFAQLLAAGTAMRFPSDSPLPDPYDGLFAHHETQHVHDCMGCVLRTGEHIWGLLTLDAMEVERFADPAALRTLQAFSDLAAATVATAERVHLLTQSARIANQPAAIHATQRQLLGHSPAMRQLQKDIALVAASELSVLITGETGTGKELVAQSVHAQSSRAHQPLVSINCAALPDNLVESELFGHVRGAFTGAVSDRRGKFEQAHQGTLFLDEVAELSLPVQAKLLRVLQSGQLQRLGSDREHHVDVRVIAATNRDLLAEMQAGRMRADFYHRLSVYPLRVPALRERDSDILVLAGFFLEENRSRLGLGGLRLDGASQSALLAHPWTGNVRELEHLLSRGVLKALSRSSLASIGAGTTTASATRQPVITLRIADLWDAPPLDVTTSTDALPPQTDAEQLGLKAALAAYERQLVESALQRHQGSWAGAARELKMDRSNLQRLARRLCIGTYESEPSQSPSATAESGRSLL